jgi:hypothetical protein
MTAPPHGRFRLAGMGQQRGSQMAPGSVRRPFWRLGRPRADLSGSEISCSSQNRDAPGRTRTSDLRFRKLGENTLTSDLFQPRASDAPPDGAAICGFSRRGQVASMIKVRGGDRGGACGQGEPCASRPSSLTACTAAMRRGSGPRRRGPPVRHVSFDTSMIVGIQFASADALERDSESGGPVNTRKGSGHVRARPPGHCRRARRQGKSAWMCSPTLFREPIASGSTCSRLRSRWSR